MDRFYRDDEETLYHVLKSLEDEEHKGFILPNTLRELMLTTGDVFREEEVDEMFNACVARDGPHEGLISIEDYAALLASDGLGI